LPDVEHSAFEVNVVPTEGEQLALPQAHSHTDRE